MPPSLDLLPGFDVSIKPGAEHTVASEGTIGFTGNVTVTNLGSAIKEWTLGFSFPNKSQKLTQGWNAAWVQSGAEVSATSLSGNGSLSTGASTSIGFSGTWSGVNPVPASFTLNGATCTNMVAPPAKDPSGPSRPAPDLRVSGNKFVTAQGEPYRLLGVSRSSGEYACVQGKAPWDGGPVDQASVDAMKTWNIHAVRIPLNEECWLGLNGSPSGPAYQQGVKEYVNLLVANGINPILDLHWTWGAFTNGPDWHCKEATATCQKPMPDAQYAPQFWTGVADAFKGNDAVVFDLFNEPYPEIRSDKTAGWQCLRDGGTCTGIPYEVAGMQDLVDAVRATGATNVLMVAGLEWTNDMSQWLSYKPNDPLNNIAASWHAYSFNACANVSCWDTRIAPIAEQVPVVLGEFGQDNCGYDYMDTLMKWATEHHLSHLAWTWNPWTCAGGAVLITDWNGTPQPGVGEGYKAFLLTQDPYAFT